MGEHLESRYRLTMSWNYEKEEQWINSLSEQGLHFKKAGMITSTFVRDQAVRYTYCLDYQPKLHQQDNEQDYFDLYHDAGWEYVSSYNRVWHYFRREWKPGEQPRLYTDKESLIGQYKKIQQMIGVMILLNMMIFIINMTNLLPKYMDRLWGIIIPVAIFYILLFLLLGYGYVKLGKKIKKQ